MQLHNTDRHGNIFLTESQLESLHHLTEDERGEQTHENGGVFVNFDHDTGVLTVDDGGDPFQIAADGKISIYA